MELYLWVYELWRFPVSDPGDVSGLVAMRIPANVTADSGNVTGIPVNVTEGRYCAF